ncbi:MAG: hypothetical protein P8179_22205 [Candidatus Thiodiazotropha sp.]|jgi:hypothetical protein
MAYKSFKYEYHDSYLVNYRIGPRREVELEIDINPVWNNKIEKTVHIRFGNIKNFDEVNNFFENIPTRRAENAYLAEIIGLIYEKKKPYPVMIDLSGVGDILIDSGNVTEI